MQTNGKNIKCKFCGEEFYISQSRFNTRKYCSKECAKEDDYGFKPHNKNLIMLCIGCHNKFHAGKTYEKEFKKIEKERGLKKLFTSKR